MKIRKFAIDLSVFKSSDFFLPILRKESVSHRIYQYYKVTIMVLLTKRLSNLITR